MLVIEGRLPRLNDYINAERTNRYIAAKIKKEATQFVAWRAKSIAPTTSPAVYTFTWTVKDKRSDPDNISFGAKFIFDGLVMAGKLPNDNMKYVIAINHKFVIDKDERVVVDIETLEE